MPGFDQIKVLGFILGDLIKRARLPADTDVEFAFVHMNASLSWQTSIIECA